MKVILTQTIKNLGKRGEIKEVKDGYARNFLFPKNLAVLPSDKKAQEIFSEQKSNREKIKNSEAEVLDLVKKVDGKKFVFHAGADKSGKLYGSIGPKEISKETGIGEKYFKQHFKKTGVNMLEIDLGIAKAKIQIEIVKKA